MAKKKAATPKKPKADMPPKKAGVAKGSPFVKGGKVAGGKGGMSGAGKGC